MAQHSTKSCENSLVPQTREYFITLLQALSLPAYNNSGEMVKKSSNQSDVGYDFLRTEVKAILDGQRCLKEVSADGGAALPLILSSRSANGKPGIEWFGTDLPRADSAAAYSPQNTSISLVFPNVNRLRSDPNYALGLNCSLEHELRHHNGDGEFRAYQESAKCDPNWAQYFRDLGSGDLNRGIIGAIVEARNYGVADYARSVLEYSSLEPESDRLRFISDMLPGGNKYFTLLAQHGADPQVLGSLVDYRRDWVNPPISQVLEGIGSHYAGMFGHELLSAGGHSTGTQEQQSISQKANTSADLLWKAIIEYRGHAKPEPEIQMQTAISKNLEHVRKQVIPTLAAEMNESPQAYVQAIMRHFAGGRAPGYPREFILPGGAWYKLAVQERFADLPEKKALWLAQNLDMHTDTIEVESHRIRDRLRWGK